MVQPLLLTATPAFAAEEPDPHLWLEDVLGECAIAWVKEQNERSTKVLEALPEYQPIYDRTLAILDSKDRIPMPGFTGDWIFTSRYSANPSNDQEGVAEAAVAREPHHPGYFLHQSSYPASSSLGLVP